MSPTTTNKQLNNKQFNNKQFKYCHVQHPDSRKEQRKTLLQAKQTLENRLDDEAPIYLDIRWVCLYRTEADKVPLARIRDCHKVLNECLQARNRDLALVPNTERAPWKPLIGNCNVHFLPEDHNLVQVEFIKTDHAMDPESPVEDAAQTGGIVDGVLNMYIAPGQSEQIVGQGAVGSNICFVVPSVVGGFDHPGTDEMYGLGKSVVHEVLHAAGNLGHIWSTTDVCDGIPFVKGLPEQLNPNFDAFIQDGEAYNDNRLKDQEDGGNRSCWEWDKGHMELAVDFLDYGSDATSLMLHKVQAQSVRNYLMGPRNTTLTLLSADASSYSERVLGTANQAVTISGATTSAVGTSESDPSALPIWIIVVIVLACILLVAGGVRWWYQRQRRKMHLSSSAQNAL